RRETRLPRLGQPPRDRGIQSINAPVQRRARKLPPLQPVWKVKSFQSTSLALSVAAAGQRLPNPVAAVTWSRKVSNDEIMTLVPSSRVRAQSKADPAED